MPDSSRRIPGPQPGPGTTALLASPEPNPPTPHPIFDRRRPTPSAPAADADVSTADERTLIELRRKVQSGELLSSSTEKLLRKMRFNGHLTIVVHKGRVLKSGYEEGYFRRRNDLSGVLLDV
jgi:hypothetical protein